MVMGDEEGPSWAYVDESIDGHRCFRSRLPFNSIHFPKQRRVAAYWFLRLRVGFSSCFRGLFYHVLCLAIAGYDGAYFVSSKIVGLSIDFVVIVWLYIGMMASNDMYMLVY